MKATEVRVVNLMAYGTTFAKITVEHLETMERSPEYAELNYRPIPLDDLWLETLGLLEAEDCRYEFPGNKLPDYQLSGNEFMPYDGYYYGFMPRLKYVHELQNLYFALTGKEL